MNTDIIRRVVNRNEYTIDSKSEKIILYFLQPILEEVKKNPEIKLKDRVFNIFSHGAINDNFQELENQSLENLIEIMIEHICICDKEDFSSNTSINESNIAKILDNTSYYFYSFGFFENYNTKWYSDPNMDDDYVVRKIQEVINTKIE